MMQCSFLILSVLSIVSLVLCGDNPCDSSNPCTEGCCSNLSNVCGYGPDYCSPSTCIPAASTNGTCSQLSECDRGVYPGWGNSWGSEYAAAENCPLNVCCSAYGFCGTTSDFCGDTSVAEPVCDGSSATKRTIAYYEGWNLERSCDTMVPRDIPIGGYTHLNFAFLYIDPDLYTITPMKASQQVLYSQVTDLKKRKSDLKVWISVGGWDFNNAGSTFNTFSNLAASKTKQSAFFQSLLNFLDTYGFDGVDLDWEYPVATERGGSSADFDNYATFLANLRAALDGANKGYGLTITLPSSYWYLKNFDIVSMAKSVDWFNMMTYDLHGGWDAQDKWIGSVVNAHTNLTEIKLAMDLLWRNNIEPSQVTMGFGFYGRSFTLNDTSCVGAGCPFSTTGNPGPCTNSGGTLSFTEIEAILKDATRGATKVYDAESAVQIVTFDGNQWVSYDDWESFEIKLDYANSHCIGGTMVWAVSLDSDGTATNGLTGIVSLFPGNDGSSGGANDIYIGPDIWANSTSPEISCDPPCTLILPPFPLSTPMTVTWPDYVTSLAVSSGGAVLTTTTTIGVSPFAVSEIPFWPITVASSNDGTALLSPMQSIAPPSMVLTLAGTEATFPLFHTDYSALITATSTAVNATITSTATSISTPAPIQSGMVFDCTKFYQAIAGDGCSAIASTFGITLQQFITWNPAVQSDCSGLWVDEYYCVAVAISSTTSTTTTLVPVFFTNTHEITVMPDPTAVSIQPPGTNIPIVRYSDGEPPSNGGCSSGSTLSGCGHIDCSLKGCSGECGYLGCDGGCGLGFCGGGCGLGGCGPGCGDGACVLSGGGGGTEEESSTSESCTATATPTTTSACDVACPQASDPGCVTLCTTFTVSCTPTGFMPISLDGDDMESWPSDVLYGSDDSMTAEANSAASWLNALYTSADPVMINGTTMTGSASAPTATVGSTTTAPTTAATAISATSCDIQTTSSTAYCSCDGGFGVPLSTKTNAAQSTFLVCAVDPALTVSTIPPRTTSTTTTSTSTTTSSSSQSTNTGLLIGQTTWHRSHCPSGYTCTDDGDWDSTMYQSGSGWTDIKGTYNTGGMVNGVKATFCGQTSTFYIDGDNIKGVSSDSKYGSYECVPSLSEIPYTEFDQETGLTYTISYAWACMTDVGPCS